MMTYNDLINILKKTNSSYILTSMRDDGSMIKNFPDLAVLDEYVHNPMYHPEGCDGENYGTALDHVLECVRIADILRADVLTKLCVLMHDVGKGVTGVKYTKERPYHNFYGHEMAGLVVAKNMFKCMNFPDDVYAPVLFCIRHHMNFHHLKEMRIHKVINIVTSPYWPILEIVGLCDDKSRMNLYDEKKYQDTINYARKVRNENIY